MLCGTAVFHAEINRVLLPLIETPPLLISEETWRSKTQLIRAGGCERQGEEEGEGDQGDLERKLISATAASCSALSPIADD